MRSWLLVCVVVGLPLNATAQETAGPLWDLGGSAGWFGDSREPRATGYSDDTNDRWIFSAATGYYWTEHLRAEVGVAATGRGRGYVSFPFQRSAERAPYAFGEYRVRDVGVSAQQFYQFGRNAWVHPYLGAGLVLSRETLAVTFDRRAYPHVPLPDDPPGETAWKVRPVLSGGLKTYVTPRAFFGARVSVSPSSGTRSVALTFGFGADLGSRRARQAGEEQGRTRRPSSGGRDSRGDER